MKSKTQILSGLLVALLLLSGCAGVNTFPKTAREGDTLTMMLANSEKASTENVAVTFTDANSATWDLQALGLVRSVFNMRTDGRAAGLHYTSKLNSQVSWSSGHEPVQTVLVVDLPSSGVMAGPATLAVSVNVDDDASGTNEDPLVLDLEIIAGTGATDDFLRDTLTGPTAVDFSRLEPAPHAKITFGTSGSEVIGAVSLVVDFDETVLNPNDISVYVPEAIIRASGTGKTPHGAAQRMVYWRQDGQQLYIDVVAPQGISAQYLQLFVLHPQSVSSNPNLGLLSATTYDLNGVPNSVSSTLEYFP